jgi:hypothetical protein
LTPPGRGGIVTSMIDREAVRAELDGLAGGEQLAADLDALVEAGLIEARQGCGDTRAAPRAEPDAPCA